MKNFVLPLILLLGLAAHVVAQPPPPPPKIYIDLRMPRRLVGIGNSAMAQSAGLPNWWLPNCAGVLPPFGLHPFTDPCPDCDSGYADSLKRWIYFYSTPSESQYYYPNPDSVIDSCYVKICYCVTSHWIDYPASPVYTITSIAPEDPSCVFNHNHFGFDVTKPANATDSIKDLEVFFASAAEALVRRNPAGYSHHTCSDSLYGNGESSSPDFVAYIWTTPCYRATGPLWGQEYKYGPCGEATCETIYKACIYGTYGADSRDGVYLKQLSTSTLIPCSGTCSFTPDEDWGTCIDLVPVLWYQEHRWH